MKPFDLGNVAAGLTWASSLQILVLLFGTAVLIHESIGGDVLPGYISVSKAFVVPEFVSNSMNQRRFKSGAKRFPSQWVLHTVKGTSSLNLVRDVLLCGDVAINPGPKGKKLMSKYPCSECHKAVRNNQDAILCATIVCGNWSHAKCLNISQTTSQYYLHQPDMEWTCPACALLQLTYSFFEEVPEGDTLILAEYYQGETTQNTALKQSLHRDVAETIFDNDRLELFRKHHNKDFLIAHLNIDSIQNKFEELTKVINKISAHIMFLSETKIDASYPNVQFKVSNYSLYRSDREKGGGEIMALISQSPARTQLKSNKTFKTLEIIAFEIKTDVDNMVIVGVYLAITIPA